MNKTVKMINIIILSMAAKQNALDNLQSEVFNVDIYNHYINMLIKINLELMGVDDSVNEYKKLIHDFLNGHYAEPDDIIDLLCVK
ncbi:MAG: hypothetical protein PWR10_841 [Halanaerobiales bacterium]|nr:hypothetical protein [Halanaerobiales bacterium]